MTKEIAITKLIDTVTNFFKHDKIELIYTDDADPYSVGFKKKDREVYVSVLDEEPGYYFCSCDIVEINNVGEEVVKTIDEKENIDEKILLETIKIFFKI